MAVAGQPGDCARAVIASLLNLPIAEVPHFLAVSDRTAFGFYSLIEDFLEARGFSMAWQVNPLRHVKEGQDVYHWISGLSPRGNDMHHCAGLLGDPKTWKHSFLKPIEVLEAIHD